MRKEVQTYLGGRVKATDFRDMFDHLVLASIIKLEGNGFVPGWPLSITRPQTPDES